MKRKSIVERVIEAEGRIVYHGKYAYRLRLTGEIQRCPKGYEDQIWLVDGRQCGAWEVYKTYEEIKEMGF